MPDGEDVELTPDQMATSAEEAEKKGLPTTKRRIAALIDTTGATSGVSTFSIRAHDQPGPACRSSSAGLIQPEPIVDLFKREWSGTIHSARHSPDRATHECYRNDWPAWSRTAFACVVQTTLACVVGDLTCMVRRTAFGMRGPVPHSHALSAGPLCLRGLTDRLRMHGLGLHSRAWSRTAFACVVASFFKFGMRSHVNGDLCPDKGSLGSSWVPINFVSFTFLCARQA